MLPFRTFRMARTQAGFRVDAPAWLDELSLRSFPDVYSESFLDHRLPQTSTTGRERETKGQSRGDVETISSRSVARNMTLYGTRSSRSLGSLGRAWAERTTQGRAEEDNLIR